MCIRDRAHRFKGLWTAACHRFYLDVVYQLITHCVIFGCICHPIAWWDRHVVDGFFNFLAWGAEATSEEIRGLQSGRIQQYTFVFLLGTLALILLLLSLIHICVPDAFIEHGTIQELYHLCEMDEEGIYTLLIKNEE